MREEGNRQSEARRRTGKRKGEKSKKNLWTATERYWIGRRRRKNGGIGEKNVGRTKEVKLCRDEDGNRERGRQEGQERKGRA